MTLEGNADERGSRDYNLGLGERRANSVSSALQANGGSGGQITVVSYGEERPTCTASSEDCWAKNRRVEIVYTAKEASCVNDVGSGRDTRQLPFGSTQATTHPTNKPPRHEQQI